MAVMLFQWLLMCLLPGFRSEAVPPHPFYVSVTEIHHNSKDKTLEISCRIFVDDMEATLKKNYHTPVDLSNSKQQAANDRMISDYLPKHLALSIDGKPARLNYVGFEKDSESVYCFFEIHNVTSLKKLDVVNSVLHDFTEDQINIMHVSVNGTRKSYKLDFPDKLASFSF